MEAVLGHRDYTAEKAALELRLLHYGVGIGPAPRLNMLYQILDQDRSDTTLCQRLDPAPISNTHFRSMQIYSDVTLSKSNLRIEVVPARETNARGYLDVTRLVHRSYLDLNQQRDHLPSVSYETDHS